MTEAFAIMLIWFGSGKYAQFDAERYNSMAECQAAKRGDRFAICGYVVTDGSQRHCLP